MMRKSTAVIFFNFLFHLDDYVGWGYLGYFCLKLLWIDCQLRVRIIQCLKWCSNIIFSMDHMDFQIIFLFLVKTKSLFTNLNRLVILLQILRLVHIGLQQIKQIQMMSRKGNFTNEKISKIISLSRDYRKHRDIVTHIRPAIDFSDQKHMARIDRLAKEKNKYSTNVRNFQLSQLQRDNENVIKRIGNVHSVYHDYLKEKPIKTLKKEDQHNMSKQSLRSVSSQKSCASNFRRRTLRQKEIQIENKKIAQRIMHPKMAKDMAIHKLNQFYQKEQRYGNIRARFSERSQKIIKSLALQGLKFQKRNVQFLPQLSFKRLNKTQMTKKNLDLSKRLLNVRSKQILDNPE